MNFCHIQIKSAFESFYINSSNKFRISQGFSFSSYLKGLQNFFVSIWSCLGVFIIIVQINTKREKMVSFK
jgi:hypothetical protein